jgi:hypothetical protein
MSEKETTFKITCQTKPPLKIPIHVEDTVLDLKNKIKMLWHLPNTNFNITQNSVLLEDKLLLVSLPKMEATMIYKKPRKSRLFFWIIGAAALIGGIAIWQIRKNKKA